MLDKLYQRILTWLETNGPRALVALAILIIGFIVIAVLRRWLVKIFHKRRTDSTLQPFLVRMSTIALQVLLLLFAFEEAGIKMTLFATLIGAFGVAAGLALSGTLQNFTGGILILILKPYKIGDNIITQGQEGIVNDVQLFYTVVTTLDNQAVIIPNSLLSNNVIINNSMEGTRRIDIEVKFPSYAVDLESVRRIAGEAIGATESLVKDRPSQIAVSGLDVDGWRIMVRAWTRADDVFAFEKTKFALQEQLLTRLKANNIKLPGM
jgi:small conductance mechanosensitive channel